MFNLAGYAICTARGSAQVVLFNGFLLLWPVMTRLHYLVSKHTPLARLFLFQHRIQFHITYGLMYYVAGWVHVVAHLVNLLFKVPCASEATWDASILARANDFAGKPKPDLWTVLVTWTALSGVIMFVCSIVAPVCKYKYHTTRHVAWNKWGHVFDAGMFGITFVHGVRHWLESAQAFPILGPPLALYVLLEVLPRYLCTRANAITRFTKTQDTLVLHLPKTKRFHNCLPGSFLRLHVPVVHPREWHPFSIVAEDQDHVTVHIQACGDWTRRLYDLVHPNLFVKIDGPIPAPAVSVHKYSVAVLIGAGIGITPYLAFLQQRLHQLTTTDVPKDDQHQTLYVHWQTNKQELFGAHQHLLQDAAALPNVHVQTYLTGDFAKTCKDETKLLQSVQKTVHEQEQFDVISGLHLPLRTRLGRPEWSIVLKRVAESHPGAQIGVFFCGPAGL
ncbi:hypothetical protein As57867_006280, partial [Aphanomyces stellatus]